MSDADTVLSSGAESWIGRTLDERYRIDRLLGEGGMGAVFVAQHLRLDKPVALKVILPEHAGNAELASRFAREAMLTAKLDHPHVVSAIDTGALPGGGAYLVMQLAKGRSLRALVVPGTGFRLACEIGAQIADALVAAHAMGIVHRDLKPENVIVEEREGGVHCRVLDFGIARSTETATETAAPQGNLTRVGTVLGTPGYMPPEQALGEVVDLRADLYSLGVIVWELAAGRSLFLGQEPGELALAQLTQRVPPLPESDVPAPLTELLDALLAPKRDDRPASAADVRDRLRTVRASAGPSLAPSGGAAVATPMPGGAAPEIPRTAVRPPVDRRWLGVALAAAAVLAALTCTLGVGALVLFGGDDASDELADVPEGLRPDVTTMLSDPLPLSRAAAARRLAAHRAELPPFAADLVDLALAQTCEARRDAVERLQTDADARALPALLATRDLPRVGCGPTQADDCHACLRASVEDAIGALGGDAADAGPASDRADAGTSRTKAAPRPRTHGRGHRR